MNTKKLQDLVTECPNCGEELGATNISPIDGDAEYLLQCPKCATTMKFSFFTKNDRKGGEQEEETEYSGDYPLGGSAEPYDIREEEKLCEE